MQKGVKDKNMKISTNTKFQKELKKIFFNFFQINQVFDIQNFKNHI